MSFIEPIILSERVISLVPLSFEHTTGLQRAAADGELWQLRVTSVPQPEQTKTYIKEALEGRELGHRFAFAVIESSSKEVLGCTSYHDILPSVKRLEIGYTWYAKHYQKTSVNRTCKLMMMTHAFEKLQCKVVGWRTDNFNYESQAAIEGLGAKKDGVIRGHALRRDGTVRDTVMYSMLAGEWPEAKAQLIYNLDKQRQK